MTSMPTIARSIRTLLWLVVVLVNFGMAVAATTRTTTGPVVWGASPGTSVSQALQTSIRKAMVEYTRVLPVVSAPPKFTAENNNNCESTTRAASASSSGSVLSSTRSPTCTAVGCVRVVVDPKNGSKRTPHYHRRIPFTTRHESKLLEALRESQLLAR